VKPVKDILRSARFMREVSLLLFFFAGLSGLVGVLLVFSGSSEAGVLATAIGSLIQAIVYLILGILIRGGSITALWIAGVLFVVDTLLQLTQPSGKGFGAAVVSRGILIYVLIRYIQRERVRG
jgi:drug/metabolite transporter (DMT)-like permease